MSINICVISGNLTRDSELRVLSSGAPVLTFSLAVNKRYKDEAEGTWKDRPNFIDCVMFGNRGEALMPLLTKGVKVCIKGELRYSSWEKEGVRRSKIEVVADDVELMNYRGANESTPKTTQTQIEYSTRQQQQTSVTQAEDSLYDTDIPF